LDQDPRPKARGLNRRRVLAILLLIGAVALLVRERTRPQHLSRVPAEVPALGPITIVATGDTLLYLPLGSGVRDPQTAAILDMISDATLAFTNLEMALLDEDEADVEKASLTASSSRWPFGVRRDARALGTLGFDLASLANNHGNDYGADAVASTRRLLAEAGVLAAGAGADLAEARRPVLTSGGRRVALVAVTTSSLPGARATAATPGVMGRPGVSPLRYAADITVDRKTFETLKQAVVELKAGPPAGDRALELFGAPIALGDRTAVTFRVDAGDAQEVTEYIRAARAAAEVVVVSIHSHEPDNATEAPAEFVREFAHRAIDAGAHLVVGHGPHRVRGVEAYGGGAILYSLGNFLYQPIPDFRVADDFDAGADLYSTALGALPARPAVPSGMPADLAWQDGLVALASFEDGRLSRLRIQPITLTWDMPETAGLPRVPGPASSLLDRLERISREWGTLFRRENGLGEVILPARSPGGPTP
jgi:poly-gamma-glutamate synthesis protein (capsule biosynthesis protein)